MIDSKRRTLSLGLAGIAAAAASGLPAGARAQAWPARPVKIIVPYPAGGGPDATVRRIAEKLAGMLGQPVLTENRPGAAAMIGAKAVATAAPDGYTLGYLSSSHATLQAITGRIDLEKEFAPIAMIGLSPFVAVVNASSPHATLKSFIDAALAQPGKLTYASAGVGSPAHIAVERLRERVPGLDLLHVPFKGAVESANAIIGGQIDFSISLLAACLPHFRSGRLKPLGLTTPERMALLPGVPTLVEAGVPGYRFDAWGGFVAPAGTPPEIVARLFAAIDKATADPDYLAFVDSTGGQRRMSASPQAFAREIRETLASEQQTVARLGLKES
ncbi:MAG: tripartite tricarboxylate transporter substrate binding protein [Burkholderiales bacterium]|nr:MAG: tripartite tricarboxylate transporter substrate binding protein [Burkholderiales bacterium]